MKIKEIISHIENFAPLSLQESYDNCGLILGSPNQEVDRVLLTIDITESIIDEAIERGFKFIISHHPIIFGPLKKINGKNYVEKVIVKAIKNDIAIYAAHTNLDSVDFGVSYKLCEKLNLKKLNVLAKRKGELRKLVTFTPTEHAEKIREALFKAGAGNIGNYDSCSYNVTGIGTFRASESTNPFVGEKGKLHTEPEVRIETIFPKHIERRVVSALLEVHPYEEVAFDIYPLDNEHSVTGMGMIGELDTPTDAFEFLKKLKLILDTPYIRYTEFVTKKIKKIAVCGGSGSTLLNEAINQGADMFISADFKYHQFFDAEDKIIIADVGHFESEQFATEIFYDLLSKKCPGLAIHFTNINTNPIKYL